MFSKQENASMSESSQSRGGSNRSIGSSSANQRSIVTETIGGGKALTEGRRALEHPTTFPDHGDDTESPVMVVQKDKSQVEMPEWMEERKSPETRRRSREILDISYLLKYPKSGRKKDRPDPRRVQYESTIRPEVAKRDKAVISMLSLEDSDDEDDDDEFEEVIIVMDVQRRPIWRRGLERARPEPQKVGVPIEDLLKDLKPPTPKVKRESTPDGHSIDEKIESVERPPAVHEAMDLAGILENL